MNAIEIKDLKMYFKNKNAVDGLNMTVPMGSIYGFIGENGSGKSTTEKIICNLMNPTSGDVLIYGKKHTDESVKEKIGVLIETPGCFMNYTVWNNLMLQAYNLEIENPEDEVRRVLKLVRMEGAASNKYKNCSLGMKQRIGIALALMGKPNLLILDEPINGLDVDGVRIVREILLDIVKDNECSILISSHILGELEKIATHYGIIRNGKMIKEMTAKEFNEDCPIYINLTCNDLSMAYDVLKNKYNNLEIKDESIRVYDSTSPEEVVEYLYENNIVVCQINTNKISLEEYYINLMNKEGK